MTTEDSVTPPSLEQPPQSASIVTSPATAQGDPSADPTNIDKNPVAPTLGTNAPADKKDDKTQSSDPALDAIRTEAFFRRIIGSLMALLGIAVFGYVIWSATTGINDLLLQRGHEGKERLVLVAMGAHATISIAAVWFGYQMLRAAERMFIPRRVLSDAADVEVLRALIGINAPSSALAEQMKTVTTELPTLVKALSDAVATLRKDKPTP